MTESIKIIQKDTIYRLLKDIKDIIKNPLIDNGIYYVHDESDMMKGYAMLIGPSNTPYFGGFYLFNFDFPYDYPFSPPKVTFKTNDGITRYNSNFYISGKVCISILNTWTGEKWSSCQTLKSILLALISLLNNTPLGNEPGESISSIEAIRYHTILEFCNINFAICDIIKHSKLSIFKIFYPFMKDSFLKNYDNILQFVESNKYKNGEQILQIYDMKIFIDYVSLKNKLINTKLIIENDL